MSGMFPHHLEVLSTAKGFTDLLQRYLIATILGVVLACWYVPAYGENCVYSLDVTVQPSGLGLESSVSVQIDSGQSRSVAQGLLPHTRGCNDVVMATIVSKTHGYYEPENPRAYLRLSPGANSYVVRYKTSSLTLNVVYPPSSCALAEENLSRFAVGTGTLNLSVEALPGIPGSDIREWAPDGSTRTIVLEANSSNVEWTGATPLGNGQFASVSVTSGRNATVTARYLTPCEDMSQKENSTCPATGPARALTPEKDSKALNPRTDFPVDLKSGEKWESESDFTIAGPSFDLSWTRFYRSGTYFKTPLGVNWDHTYNFVLWKDLEDSNLLHLRRPGAYYHEFRRSGGVFVNTDLFNEISPVSSVTGISSIERGLKSTDGYVLRDGSGITKTFLRPIDADPERSPYVLARIEDEKGNRLEFSYWPLSVDSNVDLKRFTPRLRRVTNAFGQVVEFLYSSADKGLEYAALNGTTLVTYRRDESGRLTSVTDPDGSKFNYAYEPSGDRFSKARLTSKQVVTRVGNVDNVRDAIAVNYYTVGDNQGRVQSVSKPGAYQQYSFGYSSQETIVFYQIIGTRERYSYDEEGRQISYGLIPKGGDEELVWHYYYTKANPNGVALGNTELPTGNNGSFLGFLETPGGKYYAYAYGGAGSNIWSGNSVTTFAEISPDGAARVSEYEYELGGGCGCGLNRPTQFTNEDGEITKWEYDDGNVSKIVQVLDADDGTIAVGVGNREDLAESFEYNTLGQITKHYHPKLPGGGRPLDVYTYYPQDSTTKSLRLKQIVVDSGGAGQVYTFQNYNKWGNAQELLYPDNTASKIAFNGRQLPITIKIFDAGQLNQMPARTLEYTYDIFGNVTTERVNGRLVSTFEYSGNNTLALMEQKAGMSGSSAPTAMVYDFLNHPTQITHPSQNIDQPLIDRRGLPRRLIRDVGGPDQRITKFDYDPNGNLTTLTLNDGEAKGMPKVETEFFYDGLDRLTAVMEPNGAVTAYTYFDDGQVETVRRGYYTGNNPETGTFVELGYAAFDYDSLGRVTSLHWKYNPDGPVVTELIADEFIEYHYEGSRLVFVEDSQGGRLDYTEYDTQGRVRVMERLADAASGRKIRETYAYDTDSNITGMVEQSFAGSGTPETLFTHAYVRDTFGRVTAHTVNGRTTQYAYDDQSDPRTVTVTDANLVVTEHRFDLQGRHVGAVYDKGGKNVAVTKTWNQNGALQSQSDDRGGTTYYDYNGVDEITGVRWPTPGFPNLQPLSFEYDPYGNVSRIVKLDGDRISLSHDMAGSRITRSVISGNVGYPPEYFKYDLLWRLQSVTVGTELAVDYGATAAPGGVSLGQYNSNGNALVETQFLGAGTFEIGAKFDAFGRRESLSYPSGNAQDVLNFSQDLFGRLTRIGQGSASSGAGTAVADYDWLADRLDSRTLKNGTSLQLTHNDLGQITGSTHTRAAAGDIDQRTYDWSRTYTKDFFTDVRKNGEQTLLHDPEELDGLYRLNGFTTKAGTANEAPVSYGLDGAGNRTSDSSQSAGLGGATGFSINLLNQYDYTPLASYTYDENGNLTGKSQAGGGVNDLQFHYDYRNLIKSFTNDRDQVLEDNFVGTSLGATWQVVDGAWGVDDGDLTTGPATGNTAGFIAKRVARAYDHFAIQYSLTADNTDDPNYRQHFATVMLRLGEPDRACTEYLALTLTPDGIELIQMLGGTLSVLGSATFPNPGGANRGLEVAFDGATVTVRETNVATPLLDGITVGVLGGGFVGFSVAEETEFRLDFVDLQNSQGGGVLTGSYTYDPLNRRVHKQVNDGSQVTATAYVYDGWHCIEEWEATWPVGSTPSSPTYTLAAQYVYGGYIDEVLVMRRDVDDNGSLEEYFYHADDQFNIVAVTNASGTVVERYEYGPFGAPTILDPSGAVREVSAIGNAYLWNGREYDAETGLYYYRLRYLDPELGRFTTLDPIGLWGDPNNLGNGYAYVGNRPWTGLDPYGLLTAAGVWEGVRSIPRGIVEPVLLAADIVTAFGVGANDLLGGEPIYAEDVQFSSSTANRHRQSIIGGDGAGSHVWVGAITATAMPTAGGSLLLDAIGRAWNSSPEEADRILSNFVGAHTTATVAGVGFSRLQATRETCPAGGAPSKGTGGRSVDSSAGSEFVGEGVRMAEQPLKWAPDISNPYARAHYEALKGYEDIMNYTGRAQNPQVPDGLIGAIRHERATGQQVGNTWHRLKGLETRKGLQRLQRHVANSHSLSAVDRANLLERIDTNIEALSNALD